MRSCKRTIAAVALLLTATTAIQGQPPGKTEIEKKKTIQPVGGKTLFEWTDDLRGKDGFTKMDPSVIVKALAALKFYGKEARQDSRALPAVIKCMSHADTSVRVNAVITLGFIGVDEANRELAVVELVKRLSDSQQIVRYQATLALGKIAQESNEHVDKAVSKLTYALLREHSNWETQCAAAQALGFIGRWRNNIVMPAYQALIEALKDPCQEVRLDAIFSLIIIGVPEASAQTNHVIQSEQAMLQSLATSSKQPEKISIWARVCLMRVTNKVSESDLMPIAKHLKDRRSDVRIHTARALGAIGPRAKSRLNELIDALDEEGSKPKDKRENDVLYWLIFAIGNMKSEAESAQKNLEKFKDDSDPIVKAAAVKALEMIQEKFTADSPTRPGKKDTKSKDRFGEDRDK